jgi:hypothetical protein
MPAEPPPASAAYLLDLAGRREWRLTEPAETRKLGKFVPGPPANWRSATALEPNRFDGMATAAELEVVDRWLAADGSQNTVVTTPDGETYCGRQEAWNPMSPLLEPLMQFRACGGGGKPTFEMQHPYREDAAQRRRR